jgi:16S rRNA (cytidine1402-2'-O)-methyltransferase
MPKESKRREEEGHPGPQGTLFVVATPIGNLEDITLRGLKILENTAIIAAENVSHTRGLCRHYGIKTRLISYNQHNRAARTPELIRKLQSGSDVALVTDAGTPGISDPGALLIHQAVKEEIRVTPIPGPSAVIAAISASGLPTDQFTFLGFLSNKSGKRIRELKELASEKRTMVFYEAPHRIRATLSDMRDIFGERQMVLVREMTKIYEEFLRGTAGDILDLLPEESIRGEITLVIAGNKESTQDRTYDPKVQERIEELLREEKLSLKDIASQVSMEAGMAYRQVYKECLAKKKQIDRCAAPDQ